MTSKSWRRPADDIIKVIETMTCTDEQPNKIREKWNQIIREGSGVEPFNTVHAVMDSEALQNDFKGRDFCPFHQRINKDLFFLYKYLFPIFEQKTNKNYKCEWQRYITCSLLITNGTSMT